MGEAKQMRLIGHAERIPGPTFIGARGQANQVLAVADRRLDKFVALEAPSRFDENGDQAGAAVDDVEPLRMRREIGAGEPRCLSARDKIVAVKHGARFDAAVRDARQTRVKSVVAGGGLFLDRGEGLRQRADRRRRNDRIVRKACQAREEKANPSRAVIDTDAHRAIGADPIGRHAAPSPIRASCSGHHARWRHGRAAGQRGSPLQEHVGESRSRQFRLLGLAERIDAARAEPGTLEIEARGSEARFRRGIARWRALFAAAPGVDNAFGHETASVRAEAFAGAGLDSRADPRPQGS